MEKELNKKQTAVQWLWEQIDEILPFSVDTETGIKLYNAKEQAKQMEKENIMQAYNDGKAAVINIKINMSLEEYYNITFKNEIK